MPLPDLDVLVAVVDAGSISAAAERMGTPRATVSRWLTRLEEQVGTRLLQRTTRQLVLTDAGEGLYRHARSIVEAVTAATAQVRAQDGQPRGLLRISTPPGNDGHFGEMMAAFLKAHPAVRLEVTASTRHVDLIAESIDVAIRAGTVAQSSLITRTLVRMDTGLYASPEYLSRAGEPKTPEDLRDHDCIVGFVRGEIPQRRWPLRAGGTVEIVPRMACNDLITIAQALVAGAGIGLLPAPLVPSAEGTLRPLLHDAVGTSGTLSLVYSERRLMLPRVRAFIDHVSDWIVKHPLLRSRP